MKAPISLLFLLWLSVGGFCQSFEIKFNDAPKGAIGETIKTSIDIRNFTSQTLIIAIQKTDQLIEDTQRNYFCITDDCTPERENEITVKVEPYSLNSVLTAVFEAGPAPGINKIKYSAFNKHIPSEMVAFEINFCVEDALKGNIYSSPYVVLHDVYPNPISDIGYVEYRLLDDKKIAKLLIHNILGNEFREYPLPMRESKIKIQTDELSAGIYFYTLYLDNAAVVTRKLIIKK